MRRSRRKKKWKWERDIFIYHQPLSIFMTSEIDNQIIRELIDLMKTMQNYIKKTDEELKQIYSAITELYKAQSGFWGLFIGIAYNRLMIIKSAIPSAFQNDEVKTKIEESERLYNSSLSLVQRLNALWHKLFESPNPAELLQLMGRIQEIMNQFNSNMEKFLRLTGEVWVAYLEWDKEIEREGRGNS